MKDTTTWGIERAWHLPGEDHALATVLDLRVWNRHSGKQGLGVGMFRMLKKRVTGGHLDNLAQVHDRHPMAQMTYDAQIMRDEKIREMKGVA